jgi:hypothetical protein
MAEVGKDWNSSCVVDGRPSRRFIFAGRAPDSWFVYFERGGRAHFFQLVTLRPGPDAKLQIEGTWGVGKLVRNLDELRQAVRANSQR